MITTIQSLIIILILFLIFFRFKYGIGLYLAYLFLVPYMNIHILGITFQWNFVNLIILIMTFISIRKKYPQYKFDYKPLSPFILYFILLLLPMPFQFSVPYFEQLNMWRQQMMQCLFLSFALWNIMKTDKSSIALFRNITIICIFIICGYGLFLTTIPGTNPYVMLISIANGSEFDEIYAAAGWGRLYGRISSVFAHPMSFGLFIGFALCYIYYNKNRVNIFVTLTLLTIICIDSITCGIRSTIGGIAIAMLFYLTQQKNLKTIFYLSIIFIIGFLIIEQMPELQDYLASIKDINSSQVRGSSIETRISQLYGCFDEISDCWLFGKGFNWTGLYMATKEYHPIILDFESLIYVILCNNALYGLIVWWIMLRKILRYNKGFKGETCYLLNTLLIFYLAYSCITGEYGYMIFLILFYILMLGETLKENNYHHELKS